ncbi:hypothetical protein ALP10_03191 [Pseudomonas syringae pv. helianthi]|uniref:DUF4124 domain-containing protein n=1 Tax=Pseudomonas syringae pv. helianthi TaxID=251654 RepID=A0A3M6D429_9PSED|nr:DUF4124 domain-containing protein [Pseudomonas syringae group genomosp. 7]RMV50922.1 hypothetical protein ALP10_03191 [Pseudomonas syringae pv. helianthi]
MKRLSTTLAVAALLSAGTAHGEIFKCTSAQGQVSYNAAQSALQRQGPPNMRREDEPLDYVHQTNLKATEYLKISGRTHVTVYETERYKAYQRNRPPPPNIPSQCQSPQYDSQCFDPSGGMSSKKRAAFGDSAR